MSTLKGLISSNFRPLLLLISHKIYKTIIFYKVKIAALILSFILVFFMVQPLMASIDGENKQCCSEKCCKKKDTNKKNKEDNRNCNPLMSCSYCHISSLPKFSLSVPSSTFVKKIYLSTNDTYISAYLSECWHPPNFV